MGTGSQRSLVTYCHMSCFALHLSFVVVVSDAEGKWRTHVLTNLSRANCICCTAASRMFVFQHAQRKQLAAGMDIIVSTPGRLLDLIEEGHCDLSEVSYLVLDEADRMLDL